MVRSGVAIFFALVTVASATELPDFLKVCKRTDPNLNDCITKSVEHLKPSLVTGVPEYHLPTLEPLLLKELVVSEGTGIKFSCKNIHAYGASNFMVKKVNVDIATLRFNVDIGLPLLYVEGEYMIDGRLLLLSVAGTGPLTGNFTDCLGEVVFDAEVLKGDDGVDYFHIRELRMKLTIGKGGLQLGNLFNGEKVLGDLVNSAINSNFDGFLRELLPLIADALSDLFLEIGNNIVGHFTFDQLFPE